MKKIHLVLLILCILFLPFQGFAKDECDSNKIEIKSIELVDKSLVAEELSKPEIDNMSVKTDVSLSKPGDEVNYEILVENKSSSDYELKDEDLKSDSEFINYTISFDDNDNIIKGNSEKNVYLRISYDKEVPKEQLQDGKFQDNQTINITGITKENRQSILVNPATGTIFSLILVIVICLSYRIVSKKQKKKRILLLIALLAIPTAVKAVCSFSLDVDSKVTIDTRTATFKTGEEVNIQMKKIANPEMDPVNIKINTFDDKTKFIKKSLTISNNVTEDNIVSTTDSECPIYMWFDTDTIYYYTEAKLIYLNENSSSLFRRFRALENIKDLNYLDSSKVVDLSYLFNFSQVLTNIDGLETWDVSNVKNMSNLLTSCLNLENINALKTWKTDSLVNIKSAFARCEKLTSLEPLKNWNMSHISDFTQLFYMCKTIENLSGLNNWDVSNVTTLNQTFSNCWQLKDISAISNWNVSKVVDMSRSFMDLKILENASGINDWDISNVTNFITMFNLNGSLNPVHPEFTKRPGTWDDKGTFVPNN